jgi:hypothetical protein
MKDENTQKMTNNWMLSIESSVSNSISAAMDVMIIKMERRNQTRLHILWSIPQVDTQQGSP